ncbi:MAG: MtrAB system histidine kinase MtrB [Actinomycetes bacterium]
MFLDSWRSKWRRNLQLRLVTITLLLSTAILALVGAILLNRVTTGLLQAKERSSLTEATSARDEVQRLLNATDTTLGSPNSTRLVDSVITALAVRSGSPGLFDALFLSDPTLVGQPERGTKLVAEVSVPLSLRAAVRENQQQAWQYTSIFYEDGSSVPGIAVGAPVNVPRIGQYELYLLFPLNSEQGTLDLVRSTVFFVGLILLLGLGALVGLATARVTVPVREVALVAEDLASGNLDRRLDVRGEDDLAILAASFNAMANSLQSQIVRLETLSTIQQQFVSDVSHELRTPLTTVRMASEMIYDARGTFEPAMARSAELLRNQVERFEVLLTDLLEISRFDAGVSIVDATTVDVQALLISVTDEYAEIATNHGTHFELLIPNESVFIEADGRRVSRVVRNLVVNAIEHSESKPVRLCLRETVDAISIGVRDFGQGIAPEDLERVFARFWRADPARQRTLGGTGLGLAISADDAHLHGGTIEVWGAPGLGAHFVLTLPRSIDRPFEHPAIQVVDDA